MDRHDHVILTRYPLVVPHKLIRIGGMGGVRTCVVCHRDPVDDRWQPFCSERCRNEDLARWVDGRYRLAGDAVSAPENETDTGS